MDHGHSDLGLNDRVALITGASAGIGEACARRFAAAGCRVVLNARRQSKLEEMSAQLGPERVALAPGDAADPAVIDSMFEVSQERFASVPDLVLVNAGRGLRGSVYDSDTEQWEEMVRTNVLGAARLMREAGRRLAEAGPDPKQHPSWTDRARDVVVLGSTVGRHISPFSSMYGSTKFAVNSLAEALRRQLGPLGVRVTLIEPGIVRSEFQESAGYEMEGFGAFMDSISPVLVPDDVARTIEFVVTQPPAVHINDVMLRPTRQEYP